MKVKVTLSIEKAILDIARQRKMNLSRTLEYCIASEMQIEKVVKWIRKVEYY